MDGWRRAGAALGAVKAWWSGKPESGANSAGSGENADSAAFVRPVAGTARINPDTSASDTATHDPEKPPARALVERQIQPSPAQGTNETSAVTGPSAAAVPSAKNLTHLLQSLNFHRTLELGVALDLPPGLLLSLTPWHDLQQPLRLVLEAACPLSLMQLADCLDETCFAQPNLATRIRLMACKEKLTRMTINDQVLRQWLVELLAPLANDSRFLGERLGVSKERLDRIEQLCARSSEAIDKALRSLVERVCQEGHTSRGAWLQALARTDMSSLDLERIARHWQLECPADCESWQHYMEAQRDPAALCRELLDRYERDPDAPVPLSRAWPLLQSGITLHAFPLLLDDSAGFSRRAAGQCQLSGLLSVLHHAARQEPEGLPWSCLERMARADCMDAAFARTLPVRDRPVETVSRRLRPSDLPALAQGESAEQEAMEIAGLLGVGLHYANLRRNCDATQGSPDDRALEIWRQILVKMPGLETGHLLQLFRQFDRDCLISRLTGDPDSRFQPERPLESLSSRAPAFMDMALHIKQLPAGSPALGVIAAGAEGFGSWSAPAGMDPVCRWLNHIACNPSDRMRFLRQLEASGYRPDSRRNPSLRTMGRSSMIGNGLSERP